MSVIGLLDATESEINELKGKYPSGAHVTHKLSGYKLDHNGVFYTYVSPRLRTWARIDPCIYKENLNG